MEKRLDEAYDYLKKASKKPNRDKCSLYGELLGKKLDELDDHTQDYAMLEIDKFLYGLKQQKYTSQSHKTQLIIPVSTICNQSLPFSTSNCHHPQLPTACTNSTPCPLSQQSNVYTSPCTSPKTSP